MLFFYRFLSFIRVIPHVLHRLVFVIPLVFVAAFKVVKNALNLLRTLFPMHSGGRDRALRKRFLRQVTTPLPLLSFFTFSWNLRPLTDVTRDTAL